MVLLVVGGASCPASSSWTQRVRDRLHPDPDSLDHNEDVDVDPELVRAVQRGAPGAMDALVRATYGDVHRLCLRILGDPTDAADATQEVFARLTRSVRAFRGESKFGTWLHRITVNVCATMLRKRGDQRARGQAAGAAPFAVPDTTDDLPAGDDPAAHAVESDQTRQVAQALRELSEADRAVVVLRDLEGLSTKEVARLLDISESAAKVRLHRAHARLRKAIAPTTTGRAT